MNKLIILGLATTLGVTKLVLMPVNPPVELQPSSPGIAQGGNSNITGTAKAGVVRAGTLFGDTAGTTGGDFRSSSTTGRGIFGFASALTGVTSGGFFQSASTSGRGVYGLSTATSGSGFGGYFQAGSTNGRGVFGYASSPTGTTHGVYGRVESPTGFGVFAEGNMKATGDVSGSSATFTSAGNAAKSVFGLATSAGGTTYGGYFESASSVGRGVFGRASGTTGGNFGGYFQALGSTGRGVFGIASHASGATYGVYGQATSANGFGVYSAGNMKATGTMWSGDSTVVGLLNSSRIQSNDWIRSTNNIESGYDLIAAHDVRGQDFVGFSGTFTKNTPNPVVHATNTGTGSAGRFQGGQSGVYGTGAEYGLIGSVQGTAWAVYGLSNGTGGRAVYGLQQASDGDAVVGQHPGGNGGWGVYSYGNMGASGTKPFNIDHPFDPTNKYLRHYASEAPEPQNFYNGIVVTDAQGKAWVQLPDYFSEINKEPRYQLTVIDGNEESGFVQVKVAREIRENRFLVMTSAPSVKVSWEVKAIRNDLYVRKHGAPVVLNKPDAFKGKYQHPDLYGKPGEMAESYRPPIEGTGTLAKKAPPIDPAPKPSSRKRS